MCNDDQANEDGGRGVVHQHQGERTSASGGKLDGTRASTEGSDLPILKLSSVLPLMLDFSAIVPSAPNDMLGRLVTLENSLAAAPLRKILEVLEPFRRVRVVYRNRG